jgi:hypothetical protein
MKTTKLLFTFLMVVVGLISFSCSKDDDNSSSGTTYVKPSIASETEVVTVPTALSNSTSPYAGMAVSYLEMANSMSGMLGYLDVPENASVSKKKSGGVTYSWSSEGYSVWVEYSELTTKYTYVLYVQYTGVSKYKVMEVEQNKDGSTGLVKYYNTDGSLLIDYSYVVTSAAVTASLKLYYTPTETFTMDIVAYKDNSGYVKIYESSVLIYNVVWNSAGSGTFTYYTEDGTFTETWTK